MFRRSFHKSAVVALALVLTLLVISPIPAARGQDLHLTFPNDLTKTITITGTVTGPSGPVPDVHIEIGSSEDFQETSTDASGRYDVRLRTGGQVWFSVRPDVATRLTQVNLNKDGVTASFAQDFAVAPGLLLSLLVTGHDGATLSRVPLAVEPLVSPREGGRWWGLDWDERSERHQAVLPPDVYYITALDPPPGCYQTSHPFDLRTADVIATLPLNTSYVHPIPYDPPDASKTSIGPVDDLGEAAVTGSPGAVLPLAHVLLVNLHSTHQGHAYSEADGSFEARLYAPPGSEVVVKHGPPDPSRWYRLEKGIEEGLNPLPGTIISVPHAHSGGPNALPFAAVGGIDICSGGGEDTVNYVGAAWAMSGTIGPLLVEGEWTRIVDGMYDGKMVSGLYLGGLNWTRPALGDLDGDGDLDLLLGAGQGRGRIVLYRNWGSATSPDWRFESADYADIAVSSSPYPALADVNGDGALDLFVTSDGGYLSIFHNRGTEAEPAWHSAPDVSLPVLDATGTAIADLDGDGDLDLLVGTYHGMLRHFENTGTPTGATWTSRSATYANISENQPGGVRPALVDLDGDGDLDLLLGLCGLIWYRRGGTATSPTWTRVASDPIGYIAVSCGTSIGVGDWDGDGDRDLVTGEHFGNPHFFRRDGPSTWSEVRFEFPLDLGANSAPALADWDNDGDLDMLIGQSGGQVHQYTNVGSASAPAWRPDGLLLTLPWTNHPHAFPALADIDGDQDYDLFVGEGGYGGPGAGGSLHHYRNTGTPSAPSWTLVTTNFLGLDVGGWARPAFVDIDADGDLDLFIGDEEGTLTHVENVGTPGVPAWADPSQLYANLNLGEYSAPTFADVDQDGDLDMLVGTAEGSLAYVRNVGTADSPAWELVASRHPAIDTDTHCVPVAVDLNGDGLRDLVLGDGDGGLNYYVYEGAGEEPASDRYLPGDHVSIEATLRLMGPAINAQTEPSVISVWGDLDYVMLFDARGQPLAGQNYFMSTLMTPTGFPIQRFGRARAESGARFDIEDLHHSGRHGLEGSLSLLAPIPDQLPAGIYRPLLSLVFDGVPTDTTWRAAGVATNTYEPHEAVLPPITVGQVDSPRLIWRLLMDDFVQGTRGAGAREDRGSYELASQIVSQGAPYHTPMMDSRSGRFITYRLEPFLPMISSADRHMPTPPLLPLALPGGALCVTVEPPGGSQIDLGCEAFAQSFNRTKTTRQGFDLNPATAQLDDVYSLKTASERFWVTFDQYGHHVIRMSGSANDTWGNTYSGRGTYDVWVAETLDIDPGVLPGTPLAVGDAFNPTVQVSPRVPADITIVVSTYPESDPTRATTQMLTGRANRFGTFTACAATGIHKMGQPSQTAGFTLASAPITLGSPGEYRVDLTAVYTDTDGTVYVGAMTWGGVVMTPAYQAQLIAHGRRGLDILTYIPNHWFVSGRDFTFPPDKVSHTFNPYYNGDMLWSRASDSAYGGDSLVLGASVQDTIGSIEVAVRARAEHMSQELSGPGTLNERFESAEIPLFISTLSGRPPHLVPDEVDQIAYSYRSSQRPGVRVHEVVATECQTGGYWRLDTLYDDQLGVGLLGDRANDFKFQYVGTVFRDLQSGHSEYGGQGSGWIFIPDDDPLGSRVMPPFAGPGNGGWTTEGGPILTLKGEDIHIFILPIGVRPGAILELGDTFRFAGHIMPTLDSQVEATITAPGGSQHTVRGQANRIGYFYEPAHDFSVDEPGLWSVDVRVWHDGQCSGGSTIPPYPTGDVLGSDDGRYWFYVVPGLANRLRVLSPQPGFLDFGEEVTPITISGPVPAVFSDVTVDYTISIPGYVLEQGQVRPGGGSYQIVFDPQRLNVDFPNLDLTRREDWNPGLSDTISIGLLLRGQKGAEPVYRANTVTIQDMQVFVGDAPLELPYDIYLPVSMR